MTPAEKVAFVAEKVMGWQVFTVDVFHVQWDRQPILVQKGEEWRLFRSIDDMEGTAFSPLIRISDAWMLVDAMVTKGFRWTLSNSPAGVLSAFWQADMVGTSTGLAPTATEAIVNVCIRALGGEA